tara:strand:- start:610 stop:930 length:321 start_codon:yes stop_codon:yes gene_type:complete
MPRNRKPLKVKSIRLVDSSEQYPDRDKVIVECIPCQVTISKILKAKNSVFKPKYKNYFVFEPSSQFIAFATKQKEIKEFPKEKRYLTTNLSKIDNFCNFLFQKQTI